MALRGKEIAVQWWSALTHCLHYSRLCLVLSLGVDWQCFVFYGPHPGLLRLIFAATSPAPPPTGRDAPVPPKRISPPNSSFPVMWEPPSMTHRSGRETLLPQVGLINTCLAGKAKARSRWDDCEIQLSRVSLFLQEVPVFNDISALKNATACHHSSKYALLWPAYPSLTSSISDVWKSLTPLYYPCSKCALPINSAVKAESS
jgi:hypothetical protein